MQPLHHGARGNHSDVVKMLLDSGANPKILNLVGQVYKLITVLICNIGLFLHEHNWLMKQATVLQMDWLLEQYR